MGCAAIVKNNYNKCFFLKHLLESSLFNTWSNLNNYTFQFVVNFIMSWS